jgi:hypothetical protein
MKFILYKIIIYLIKTTYKMSNTDCLVTFDKEIFNISKINKEFTQNINMYIIYDTAHGNPDQNYLRKKHLINKELIETMVNLYKKIIEKYDFSGTVQIIPQNRYSCYGPLEIYIPNNQIKSYCVDNIEFSPKPIETTFYDNLTIDSQSIKTQINEYLDSAISYHLFDNNNTLRSFIVNLNHSAKNLISYMNNSECFSYNVSIIFSDNFDQYNKYIFSIVNEMTNMITISQEYTYGYIIRCEEFVNFIIIGQKNNEKYFSEVININDPNKFAINFNIFFERLLSNIHKKIKTN